MALNPLHALYANITRSLKGHEYKAELTDQIAADDVAGQSVHAVLTEVVQPNVTPQQGIATDGLYWYAISSGLLEKRDFVTGALSLSNSSPYAALPSNVNHIGDGFVYDGLLYVPIVKWNGTTQTSTLQTIATFNTSDLTLNSQFDVSAQTAFNASGLCRSKTGTILGVSYETSASSEAEQHTVYEFNLSTGAFIATHTLDFDCKGTQGIDYDQTLDRYLLTSHDPDGKSYVHVFDTSYLLIEKDALLGVFGYEIEGICAYSGDVYVHTLNAAIRKARFRGLQIAPAYGEPPRFLTQAQTPEEGSIVFRITPETFFNYNSVIDNKDQPNGWESWIYSTGQLAWRVDSATKVIYTLPTAGQEYVVMLAWKRVGSTVEITLGVDGVIRDTATGTWIAAPALGLWLGGANSSNGIGDNLYSDVVLFDKVLSSTEFADLDADFDAIYVGSSATLSGSATASITETDINDGGKQIILDLLNTVWVAAGATFDAIRQDILDGLVSDQNEQYGWNNEVIPAQPVTAVVRTSDTRVTITLVATTAIITNMTELPAIDSSHYRVPSITFPGDFAIEMEFSTTSTANQILIGDTYTEDYYFRTNGTLGFKSFVSGSSYLDSTANVTDGKMHKWKVSLEGTTLSTYLDSVLIGSHTVTPFTSPVNFRIGDSNTAHNYFDGIIREVKIWNDGTPIHHYKADETWVGSSALKDQMTVLGSEEWSNSPNIIGAGWTDNGDDTFTCDGTNNALLTDTSSSVSDYEQYLVTYTIENYVAGSVRALVYGSGKVGLGRTRSGNGTYTELVSVKSTTSIGNPSGKTRFQSISSFNGTISNISIREASGYGQAINITDANSQKYTFNGSVSPNTWTGDDSTVIEVAGT